MIHRTYPLVKPAKTKKSRLYRPGAKCTKEKK